MNKRIWSIAVALAMLLSMVCSAFVVSAAETQSAAQIEEDQIIEEIELLQEAPLLAAESNGLPSLKLSPSSSDIAVGSQFTVDLSLENYADDWATFTADLLYDAEAVQYLGYDASNLPANVSVSVDEYSVGTLTMIFLSEKGENFGVDDGANLLTLSFKAIAEPAAAPFSAAIVEETVARYNGESTELVDTTAYNEDAIVDPCEITKKLPYLTIRLIEPELDEEGNEILITTQKIQQGKELCAIVTLNDYYDPWMALTLSLNYDSSLFTYVESENEDLDAFDSTNGKMTAIVADTDDENAPLSVCFMSSDLSNRPLKNDEDGNAVAKADVLKLKFVVNSNAEPDEGEMPTIGTSFVENGNLKTDPETEDTITLTPEGNDFMVNATENGAASVTIETIERPYLTLEVVDSEGNLLVSDPEMKIEKGASYTVRVIIKNFKQYWSMMSIFAQFDSDIFEILLDANGDPDVKQGVYGAYMMPVLVDNILGVTMFSATSEDTGLTGDVTEGIVLEIPLKVRDDAVFGGAIDPFQVFFDTEGNYSGGELVDEAFFDSKQEDPVTIEMKAKGQPQVKMTHTAVGDANLNNLVAGNQVQFRVSVEKFISPWSAMSLLVNFNSEVFKLVDNSVVNSEPFKAENGVTSEFTSYGEDGFLLACWFNSADLPMISSESQEVMTFTLEVKDGYTVDDVKQYISVQFDEEGNYAEGEKLTGSAEGGSGDYIDTPAQVEVTVEQPAGPTYVVTIAWDDDVMKFTYNFGTWDTANHVWKDRGWKCEKEGDPANWIKVTNDGTNDITATFAFTEKLGGVSGAFYEDAACSSPKSEVTVSGSNSADVYFMPNGEPTAPVEEGVAVNIGTIVVTIS